MSHLIPTTSTTGSETCRNIVGIMMMLSLCTLLTRSTALPIATPLPLVGTTATMKMRNTNISGGSSSSSSHYDQSWMNNPCTEHTCPCDRPWPKIELFLPVNLMYTPKLAWKGKRFENIFLRSLLLFWPLKHSNTSLTLMIDEEMKSRAELLNALLTVVDAVRGEIPGGVAVQYNKPSRIYTTGHNRQQLLMFHADQYASDSNAEYIAFSDTDALFLTTVDREDLFENGKPVINGRTGPEPNDEYAGFYSFTSLSTEKMFLEKETMRCMSYFPVIIKKAHLKELRNYLEVLHKTTFNELFRTKIQNAPYSQFNMMCQFLYKFHRDDYTWYVHSNNRTWDGINPPPNRGQNNDTSIFSEQMKLPKPRIATHAGYRIQATPLETSAVAMQEVYSRGVCISPPFVGGVDEAVTSSTSSREGSSSNSKSTSDNKLNIDMRRKTRGGKLDCTLVSPDKHWREMHLFEGMDWTQSVAHDVQELDAEMLKRYNRIKTCTRDWSEAKLNAIFS